MINSPNPVIMAINRVIGHPIHKSPFKAVYSGKSIQYSTCLITANPVSIYANADSKLTVTIFNQYKGATSSYYCRINNFTLLKQVRELAAGEFKLFVVVFYYIYQVW